MREFLQKNRRQCIIVGIVIAVALFVAYLCALLQPGLWHRNAFLYLQKDGSFVGSDEWANYYHLMIDSNEQATTLNFTVNDLQRQYLILQEKNGASVQIYENEQLVFDGTTHSMGDSYLLMDKNGAFVDVTIVAGGVAPTTEELFPKRGVIYKWATLEEYETRGNLHFLICIILCLLFFGLDVAYPNLFWNISHGLAVDGGEPSEFYRVGQVLGRVLMLVAVFAAAAASF